MSDVVIYQRFVVKRDTAAAFASANTLLKEGEFALETDTRKMKLGDGATVWNSLGYLNASFWPYQPSSGGLDAENVQDAIDELFDKKLEDSPSDGTTYGRKDGAWVEVDGLESVVAGIGISVDATDPKNPVVSATGGGGGGAWALVMKTSDEARNTTTTLADDSTLKVALSAGKTYRIRIKAMFRVANATMDLKYGENYTGTLTSVDLGHEVQMPGGTRGAVTANALTASRTAGSSASGSGILEYDFIVVTTTAGTLSLQWAQQVSNAGDLTFVKGSYLEYMEIT